MVLEVEGILVLVGSLLGPGILLRGPGIPLLGFRFSSETGSLETCGLGATGFVRDEIRPGLVIVFTWDLFSTEPKTGRCRADGLLFSATFLSSDLEDSPVFILEVVAPISFGLVNVFFTDSTLSELFVASFVGFFSIVLAMLILLVLSGVGGLVDDLVGLGLLSVSKVPTLLATLARGGVGAIFFLGHTRGGVLITVLGLGVLRGTVLSGRGGVSGGSRLGVILLELSQDLDFVGVPLV